MRSWIWQKVNWIKIVDSTCKGSHTETVGENSSVEEPSRLRVLFEVSSPIGRPGLWPHRLTRWKRLAGRHSNPVWLWSAPLISSRSAAPPVVMGHRLMRNLYTIRGRLSLSLSAITGILWKLVCSGHSGHGLHYYYGCKSLSFTEHQWIIYYTTVRSGHYLLMSDWTRGIPWGCLQLYPSHGDIWWHFIWIVRLQRLYWWFAEILLQSF